MAESWRNRKTLILSWSDMVGLLTPAEYVDRVEHAYRMHGLGRVYMEPKGHIVLDKYKGEWEVMPSYIEEPEAAASARWLARKDSKALAILGSGLVGRGSLATCDTVFPWEDVRIWSRTHESVDRFMAEEAPKYPHLRITGTTDVRTAVEGADVIVTGTHARKWLVDDAWVKPGAHIAALGADLKGEQELDPRTLQRARVFVDDIRQCREDGEINVALTEGAITEDDLAGEIGKVICGDLEGRQSDEQVTVFDSTGIALQDSATVPLEYERAVAAGVGVEKKMIST